VYGQPLVQVHDLDTGRWIALRHPGIVRGLAWCPDGKRLATACEDRKVYVWDVNARQPMAALEGHQGVPNDATFNAAGNLLAANGWDHQLCVWDLASR
jgi:WD40 repeat protein